MCGHFAPFGSGRCRFFFSFLFKCSAIFFLRLMVAGLFCVAYQGISRPSVSGQGGMTCGERLAQMQSRDRFRPDFCFRGSLFVYVAPFVAPHQTGWRRVDFRASVQSTFCCKIRPELVERTFLPFSGMHGMSHRTL